MRINQFLIDFKIFLSKIEVIRAKGIKKVTLVLNPVAGGFSHLGKYHSQLEKKLQELESLQSRDFKWEVIQTEAPGHGAIIAQELGNRVTGDEMVILMGGDGTSMEFCSGLMQVPLVKRSRLLLFRVPMGTGNDGLDAVDFQRALDGLVTADDHQELPAVKIEPQGMDTQYAFNIGTIGLDAFVTHMTNLIKKYTPGSFYKVMVDFTTLFYDLFVKIRPMDIRIQTQEGEKSFHDRVLLMCMGASGYRTYGNQMKILPDSHNLLAVGWASILRRILVKGTFYTGEHRNIPEAHFYETESVEVSYEGKILLNRDGDTLWLNKENFPLRFSVIPSGISVLKIP